MELIYTLALEASGLTTMQVQVLSLAPKEENVMKKYTKRSPHYKFNPRKLELLRTTIKKISPDFSKETIDMCVWQMDMAHYEQYGKPITGAVWIKTKKGVRPVHPMQRFLEM